MATDNIETTIKNIQNQLEQLQDQNEQQAQEIERLKAYAEIQNMMGRYEYYATAGKYDELSAMFARKAPGFKSELNNSGVFKGEKGIERLDNIHKLMAQVRKGRLTVHTLTTPVVEVARDGKTAKALWLSPGYLTTSLGKDRETNTLRSYWLLEEYAIDFVKEEDGWKFWHIHLYRVFCTPYDKSWAETDSRDYDTPADAFPENMRPDEPTTYHNMYLADGIAGMMEYVPPAPEPYETWEDTFSY